MALQFHADLLYSNPLSKGLKVRERDRFVRKQLATYLEHLRADGFIKTTVRYKDAANSFLRGFFSRNGQLFYEPTDDVLSTPMKRCVLALVGRDLANETDMLAIRFIKRWLRYLSKFPLARPDLRRPAEAAWTARQESPTEITAPTRVFEEVRRIVSWLIDLKPNYVGNHGPGSTSNGAKTVPDKNQDYYPTRQTLQITRFHVDNVTYGEHLIRQAAWMVVFKDVGSLRPITMEPVEMQYAQQGLKYDLYQQIDDPRYDNAASDFIRFSDQGYSQVAAIEGSRLSNDWRKPSTIDLSAASDHLSVLIICNLFSGNLLHDLMCGRSHEVRLGKKKVVELSMYGGMGSALTFPVQTLVFCALTVYATLQELYLREFGVEATIDDLFECYIRYEGLFGLAKSVVRSIRIYGDDIACPDIAAERLMKLLESFGLRVNHQKSFTGDSPVRESCGVYALAGYDITSKLLRVPDSGQVMDGAQYEALRSMANEAFLMGDLTLYRAVVKHMESTEVFMSSRESKRVFQRSPRLYPRDKWELDRPKLLFEEFSGQSSHEDVAVGILSTRGSTPTKMIRTHDDHMAFTTYFVETPTERDLQSEYYHLTVNYRLMAQDRPSIEKHGSIPKGTRLKPRIATLSVSSRRGSFMDWGWAPS